MNNNEKLFSGTKSAWESQLDELFSKKSDTEIELIFQIVSLIMNNGSSDNIQNLYSIVDLENFIRVISLFDGKTIKFPSKQSLKEIFIWALCYYYKEIKGMSWKEIEKLIPYEISTISYGVRIKQLNKYIEKEINKIAHELEDIDEKE